MSEWSGREAAMVKIKTLGFLQIHIGKTQIDGHRWRGRRTRQLLEAIIAMGATGVPVPHLCDNLWPDTEGDRAMGNFKVTLSRLRRLGTTDGMPLTDWIRVHDSRVSLKKSKCHVDAIHFETALDKIIDKKVDINQLTAVMDLYVGDFLSNGHSDPWVIKYRQILRDRFVRAALLLAEACLECQQLTVTLPYLHQALACNRLNEEVYAAIMRCHLEEGFPSKAIQIYLNAESLLASELHVQPGKVLNDLAHQTRKIW